MQRRRRMPETARPIDRSPDHRAMAAMHALKIAHGHHRAPQRAGMGWRVDAVVNHDERLRWSVFGRHGQSRSLGYAARPCRGRAMEVKSRIGRRARPVGR